VNVEVERAGEVQADPDLNERLRRNVGGEERVEQRDVRDI
jgi:hypothetical protein